MEVADAAQNTHVTLQFSRISFTLAVKLRGSHVLLKLSLNGTRIAIKAQFF